MNGFELMQYGANGMQLQRGLLDIDAQNIALIQTADGSHPVHPLVPEFAQLATADDDGASDPESALDDDASPELTLAGAQPSAEGVTNVDTITEMVKILDAQRAYEANATVFDLGKHLTQRTLSLEQS